MKKEIKLVDEKKGIVRVTIADERFYIRTEADPEGLPVIVHQPSSTWISHFYYTSPWLVKWIADKGMDEAELIRKAAADKGSAVHNAITMWLNGNEIKIDTKVPVEGEEKELSAEENEMFKSFQDFYRECKPKIVAYDYVVWGRGYSGTVDIKCEIDGELGILDIKSSQKVYTEHKLQVSSYREADEDRDKITKRWILQLGYRKNEKRWKLNEVDDKIHLFRNAMDTWKEERGEEKPKYIEYPLKYPTKEELDKELGIKINTEASNSPVAKPKASKQAKVPLKQNNG